MDRFSQKLGLDSSLTGNRAVIYDPDSGGAIVLNPVGTVLWARMASGASKTDLVDALLSRFAGLDQNRASTDVENFLISLTEAKLIEAARPA